MEEEERKREQKAADRWGSAAAADFARELKAVVADVAAAKGESAAIAHAATAGRVWGSPKKNSVQSKEEKR